MNQAEDIIQLEKSYWDAMKNKDVESAIALTKFPCVITGPTGTRRVSEDSYRRLMQKHDMSAFRDVEIENEKVDLINDQTAVITYETVIDDTKMLDVSTWSKSGEGWKCAFHSEYPLRKKQIS